MALADAAGAAANEITRILAERELRRRQAIQDAIAQQTAGRQNRELDLRAQELQFNRERQGRLDEETRQQRAATEASSLADQIPADTFVASQDPAVAMMQQGGRGSLLVPSVMQRPAMGEDFQGPMPTGETPQEAQTGQQRGFLKTRSQKQRDTDTDNERQAAVAAAQEREKGAALERELARDAEATRHNRATEGIAQQNANKPAATSTRRSWVLRNGQAVRVAEDEIQPGDKPYSATQTPAATNQNEVQDAIDLIDQIDKDPALNASVGPLDAYGLGKVTNLGGVNRFEALHNELVGKLQLAQAGKLKGQGQVSDREREMLRNAATALTRQMSERDYKAELQKIRAQFQRLQTAAPTTEPPASGSGFRVIGVR